MLSRIVALAFALGLFPALAMAQSPLRAFPPGTFQSRAAIDAPTAASYQGPGDVISSAKFWVGLRCYNAAYTGNVADVYAPSDASHTLLTCSTGGIINETLQALSVTCATSCTVKTLFDQSGLTNCTTACDFTQATIANRPALTRNCVGALPCMSFVSASSQQLVSPSLSSAIIQPYSGAYVAARTALFTTAFGLLGQGANHITGWSTSTNTIRIFNGSSLSATAADSTNHSLQTVSNNTTSAMVVDGSATSGISGAGSLGLTTMALGNSNSSFGTGNIMEVGIWAGAWTPTQYGNMQTNQKAYWSTP